MFHNNKSNKIWILYDGQNAFLHAKKIKIWILKNYIKTYHMKIV